MKLKGLLIMQLQKGSHNKLLISCYYLNKRFFDRALTGNVSF